MKKDRKNIWLIIILIIYQTFMYLITKLSPFNINILSSNIDLKIPFISYFVYLYISWYLMLFLIPYWLYKSNKESFYKYVLTIFMCITISAIIYLFYPTTIERPDIIVKGLSTAILKFIYIIDTPAVNCMPSMHCIICFAFIYYTLRNKEIIKSRKIIILAWSTLVIISTLFTKQHLLIDMISAFIETLLVCILIDHTSWWKKIILKGN